MSDIKYITFGSTTANLAVVAAMSEEEFKTTFRGLLNVDLGKAWKEIQKHQPKEVKQPKKKKKYFNSED